MYANFKGSSDVRFNAFVAVFDIETVETEDLDFFLENIEEAGFQVRF